MRLKAGLKLIVLKVLLGEEPDLTDHFICTPNPVNVLPKIILRS